MSARLIALSRSYQNAGELLMRQAHADFAAATISADDYNDVFLNKYVPLLRAAASINNAALAHLAKLAAADIAPIERATAKLNDAVKAIDATTQVVTLTAELLAAVGLVAAAVVDPTKASVVGAASALESFVADLVRAAKAKAEARAVKAKPKARAGKAKPTTPKATDKPRSPRRR